MNRLTEKIQAWGRIGFLIVAVIAAFSLGIFVRSESDAGYMLTITGYPDLESYDTVYRMGCDTGSMGLTIPCNSEVFTTKVEIEDSLTIGDIYLYNNTDGRPDVKIIGHRLVACIDEECSQTVFKGDNNRKGEIVNRSLIFAHVEMIKVGGD